MILESQRILSKEVKNPLSSTHHARKPWPRWKRFLATVAFAAAGASTLTSCGAFCGISPFIAARSDDPRRREELVAEFENGLNSGSQESLERTILCLTEIASRERTNPHTRDELILLLEGSLNHESEEIRLWTSSALFLAARDGDSELRNVVFELLDGTLHNGSDSARESIFAMAIVVLRREDASGQSELGESIFAMLEDALNSDPMDLNGTAASALRTIALDMDLLPGHRDRAISILEDALTSSSFDIRNASANGLYEIIIGCRTPESTRDRVFRIFENYLDDLAVALPLGRVVRHEYSDPQINERAISIFENALNNGPLALRYRAASSLIRTAAHEDTLPQLEERLIGMVEGALDDIYASSDNPMAAVWILTMLASQEGTPQRIIEGIVDVLEENLNDGAATTEIRSYLITSLVRIPFSEHVPSQIRRRVVGTIGNMLSEQSSVLALAAENTLVHMATYPDAPSQLPGEIAEMLVGTMRRGTTSSRPAQSALVRIMVQENTSADLREGTVTRLENAFEESPHAVASCLRNLVMSTELPSQLRGRAITVLENALDSDSQDVVTAAERPLRWIAEDREADSQLREMARRALEGR